MKKAAPLVPLRPLTCSAPDGTPYVRPEAVQAEIQTMLQRPVSDWIPSVRDLKSESLVFLIRYIRRRDEKVHGQLQLELSKRTVRIAELWVHGVYKAATENIVLEVESEIMQLLLTDSPSRQSEFLEIAFGQAVARRATNAVRNFKRTSMGHQGNGLHIVDENEEEIERPIEMVPDDAPGPEEICRCQALVAKACTFVKDPRHLEAVILRYLEGWPMTDEDPDKPCIVRHFQKSARQIRNWINVALEQMKEGISGDNHGRTKLRS